MKEAFRVTGNPSFSRKGIPVGQTQNGLWKFPYRLHKICRKLLRNWLETGLNATIASFGMGKLVDTRFAIVALHVALIIGQWWCLSMATALSMQWTLVNDDLSDYKLIKSFQASSSICCVTVVSRYGGVHVATFNTITKVCAAFACRLGLSHCRKCRNSIARKDQVWSVNTSCWITVQHRVSGSVDFYCNWSDYKAGFGEGPDGNFWIGLVALHNLTTSSGSGRQLRFLMRSWNNSQSWAQYSAVSVGPEANGFSLSESGFSGSPGVGDSLSTINGSKFSSRDKDQDSHPGSCANIFRGAWWFSNCFRAHPNGVYLSYPTAINGSYAQGIIWSSPYGFYYSLMEIEILIL